MQIKNELFAFIGIGLTIIISVLSLSQKTLSEIGQGKFLSPNWISFWRLPIFYLGIITYFNGNNLIGALIVVFSCILDTTDGRVARALQKTKQPRSAISIWIGQWIDPLIDKITILPIIGYFAYQKIINPYLAINIIAIDLLGTIIREPIFGGFQYFHFSNPKLKKWQTAYHEKTDKISKKTKASIFGKIKTLTQEIGLVFCAIQDQVWINKNIYLIINTIFMLALAFGGLSVLNRVQKHLTKPSKSL